MKETAKYLIRWVNRFWFPCFIITMVIVVLISLLGWKAFFITAGIAIGGIAIFAILYVIWTDLSYWSRH